MCAACGDPAHDPDPGADDDDAEEDAPGGACCCDWPADDGCGGFGVLFCEGCGGDLCICRCGGEVDCPGCDACEARDEDDGER